MKPGSASEWMRPRDTRPWAVVALSRKNSLSTQSRVSSPDTPLRGDPWELQSSTWVLIPSSTTGVVFRWRKVHAPSAIDTKETNARTGLEAMFAKVSR